jgi:toxin-antitoxin system PIN domain toxin
MKPTFLLDVNVLIALAWPSHIHHSQTHVWFEKNSAQGWATCPITQLGFVRVSSNPSIIKEASSPKAAMNVLEQMTALKHHVFWPDNIKLCLQELPSDLLVGHRQITDAYLLGLCKKHGGRLATLDQKITTLTPKESMWRSLVEIIEA